jgi:hypothetical protein
MEDGPSTSQPKVHEERKLEVNEDNVDKWTRLINGCGE